MGKISKLMKLLSASAVVAGANSVALADCGLCGDKTDDHKVSACPHFDYRGYGLSKGYKPETLPDNDFLGKLALADRKNADAFLNTPKSTTVTFLSDNSDSATTISESDATETQAALEEMKREEAAHSEAESEHRAKVRAERLAERRRNKGRANFHEERNRAEDLQNLFDEENARKAEAPYIQAKQERARVRDGEELKDMMAASIAKNREDRRSARELRAKDTHLQAHLKRREKEREELASMVSKSLSDSREAERNERLSEAQAAHSRAVNAEIARLNERAARQRDTKELRDMMRERVAEDLGKSDAVKSTSDVQDLGLRHRGAEEAKGVAYDNRAEINISDREKIRILAENISQADERRNAREARNRETAADELRKTQAAANKIQNAARRRLARKKAADLKEEAERQGKIQEYRENAAARKLTEALRKNKERKEAQRRAQIDGDYELAKKLQAEYDAEDRQIRADRLLAEQEQLRENLAAVPVEEARNGEDFEYRSERDQINADNLLAQQEQAREYLGMNTQEQSHTTAIEGAGVADEEVETDRWTLPQATAWNFKGFDFGRNRKGCEYWARQLEDLSVRKIEFLMFVLSVSYKELLSDGADMAAQIVEAVADVDDIYHYTGNNAALVNVCNAWNNADNLEGFVTDLNKLGAEELNGVLYYIANRYMHLLLPGNGKKAASRHFIELAKAVLEYFGAVCEAEDAQVFGEENETPGVDNTEPAVVNENRQEPQVSATAEVRGIVETERAEDTEWNIPYVLHEVLKWPLGSYKGGDNRRVYLGKFNEALQDLGIRRLEVVMYLAASSYQFNKVQGQGALGEQSLKLAKDIYNNVFPTAEIKPNARLANCCRALENMHDKPLYFGKLDHYGRYSFENNDMKTYEGSFQGAFRRITAGEQEVVLGKIATLYREKLREGKHPSSMLFVDFADEICKELNLDGFFGGEDTEEDHPAWDKVNKRPMWEFRKEFESDVQPAVVNPQNADQNTVLAEDPETNPWRMPEGVNRALMYDPNIDATEVLNEGEGLNVQAALQRLTVRQLEAVIGLSACAYKSRSGAKNVYGKVETATSNEMLEKAGKLWSLILSAPKGDNERLLHVYNALRSASNAKSLTEDLNFLPLRKVEGFLGMAFQVYKDKLRHGVVPADEAFVTMTDEVLELLSLNYDEEEAPAEDEIRHGALDDDNRALVEPIGA